MRLERVAGEGRSVLNEDSAAAGGEKLETAGLVGGVLASFVTGLEGGTGEAKPERLPRTGTVSDRRWGRGASCGEVVGIGGGTFELGGPAEAGAALPLLLR